MRGWRATGAGLLLVGLVAAGCQLLVDVDGLQDHHCRSDEKPCPSLKQCVKKDDPNTGCGSLTSCTPCALPHSVARCEQVSADDWRCKVVACEKNWDRCGTQLECETDIQHDPDHCGGCTTVCQPFPNAFRACSGGCTIGGCKPGFRDCNLDPGDGCEVEGACM